MRYLLPLSSAEVTADRLVPIDELTCRLMAGVLPSERPSWASHVRSLTGIDVELPGSSPFAVLLVPLGRWTYAIAWGAGHLLLDDQLIDPGFGLQFGIRRLDPSRLGFVASSALGTSGRSSQTSIPGGSDLGGFHLQPYGDLINRLAGAADLSGLTYHRDTGRRYRIRTGDGLFLPLPCNPRDLIADLLAIEAAIEAQDSDSLLRPAFRIRPVPKNDRHLAELGERLAAALGGDERFGRLGLAWPAEAVDAAEGAVTFRTLGLERNAPPVERDLELEDLVAAFKGLSVAGRVNKLGTAKLVACADEDGTEMLGRPIAIRKWLVFETSIGFTRYCYNQGQWFKIGEKFVSQIRDQVTDLLKRRADLRFPLWTPTGKPDDEHRFCLKAAMEPGYLCLDQNFATTPLHPRLELCDLVGPQNELIHVKWLTRATAASHLYTQALASATSLRDEPEARAELDKKVRAHDASRAGLNPSAVVLAIAGRRWDIDQLFALSQIDLLRLDSAVRHQQMTLQFADIPYVEKKRSGRAGQAA
ncbi:TIGR04141 family sporadically distributed protein [Gandjariella thermophila]|uniref:TIGR04141 family sporadically distributed protein n=1 Tax=Gandjariella thermophila TaxID=1931992 RepID=A0A4D4JHT3_9PSEU|nr:hypothetical protein GTS_55890 [Gandjariella thermophila]